MHIHIKGQKNFKLYGAALAIAALAIAIMLAGMTAGPAMAEEPRTGDNEKEYPKPYPCSEEVEPDAKTTGLVREGYYAVFDGFWDYEVGHLSNNFCPPKVTETTKYDPQKRRNVPDYTREDGHVHISKTVFSIPDSYKVTVIDSGKTHGTGSPGKPVTGPTIDLADFPFLKSGGAASAVDDEENPTAFAGNTLYWVRLDQPWTPADETSRLKIGFSTDLMEEADWYRADGAPVQFKFAAVHVLQDGTPVEAHVLGAHMFAFDQRKTNTTLLEPKWSNVETDPYDEINMQVDQYRPMQFVFTKPGQYLVQAQVQGHVRDEGDRLDGAPGDWKPVNSDKTITSPVQWYTFHVGSEAELSVNLTAGEVSGNTVPITVTAHNGGPNDAENVEVEVNLPAGLSAPATLPDGAVSSGCGVIAWKIGTVRSGTTATLPTFNATVNQGASGNVTATAEIRSTTFDPNAANNAASADMTLSGTNVRPPFFPGVSRTIVEHAVAGSHAGDPVAATSPDGRALSYSLSGPCHNKFQVHSNGQIVLAAGHTLDYEKQWEYPLTLHVSDGVNASGGADTSADDSMPVLIQVQDTLVEAVHPTVTFTLSNPSRDVQPGLNVNHPYVGQTVNVNAHVHNLPEGETPSYTWENPSGIYSQPVHTSYYSAAATGPGSETYRVHVKWNGGGITASYTIEWFRR